MDFRGTMIGGKTVSQTQLRRLLQQIADAFLSGDHEWLCSINIYPLVVYVHQDIHLEWTALETQETLLERRQAALRAGVEKIEAKVLNVGASEAGRFPVRVNWTFMGSEGNVIARNRLRYYCRLDETGHIRIEILELLKRGLSKMHPEETAHRH